VPAASEEDLKILRDLEVPEAVVGFFPKYGPARPLEYGPCVHTARVGRMEHSHRATARGQAFEKRTDELPRSIGANLSLLPIPMRNGDEECLRLENPC
jgi:hypothetical protein